MVLKKHLSDATKTLFFGCWKNTAGADKTPWMLRKPRVLKKHLLDAGKVPDAGKTPFQCWKNPQPKSCEPLFRVNGRLDHLSCKRYRLQEPLKILASEAYSEILGLDVVLQSRVSKSTRRYLVANPGASKTELETSAREYWLSVLVTFLEESDMPICKIAAGTTDPGAVLRRSFGSRRMKTLRNRARAWKKVRSWMLLMRGRPFLIDISDMLDHILFLVQEEASRSRIIEVSCALSVLEAGQVASEGKISDSSLWKQAINSRLCEIEQDGCTVSKAPPLSVATLISLELFISDTGNRVYCRAIAWVILLCVWGCMRLSDLEGLDPQRIHLSSRGLSHPGSNQDNRSWEKGEGDTNIFGASYFIHRCGLVEDWT